MEVKNIPILTPDEEYEISIHAQGGDEVALSKLINHNLRFVISVAKQYATEDLKLEDLVNEGNLGLVIAAKRFDPSRGFKFISYGVWWIRRSILAYISEHSRTIRLPSNKNSIIIKIKQRSNALEQSLGYKPTFFELSESLGGDFTDKEIEFYLDNEAFDMLSIDANVENSEYDTSYSELLKSTGDNCGVIRTDHFTKNGDSEDSIKRMLKMLKNDKERKVLTLIYGLDGGDPLKLQAVSIELNITSERVRQIRDKALLKLKKELKSL